MGLSELMLIQLKSLTLSYQPVVPRKPVRFYSKMSVTCDSQVLRDFSLLLEVMGAVWSYHDINNDTKIAHNMRISR